MRYRPGGYAEFRESMHAALTSARRPVLAGLSTRDDEDFSVALLDATACVAEVLTFYTERLVNESYLRTALHRPSLAELGKLVGYRLRPGVSAGTHLAFHVQPPPAAAVETATTPFQRARMPVVVTIPAGVQVRSVPGQGEQSEVFETAEALRARPAWNLMRPVTTKPAVLDTGRQSMYVSGTTANLKPGDLLLFHANQQSWEVRPARTVTPQAHLERTLVTWRDALTKPGPLTPYVMRKRLSFFGHNAPRWQTMSKEFKTDYGCPTGCSDWPAYLSSPLAMTSDMDGSHPDIATGGMLVFASGADMALFTAEAVTELSRSEFAVSGKATRVRLGGSPAEYTRFDRDVRGTTVHAVSEALPLAPEPDPFPVGGDSIVVAGDVRNLPEGRTLLIVAGDTAETVTLKSAESDGVATLLTLTGNLTAEYEPEAVQIFGNVVAATHGQTVHQILGDGDAARPFQRFELKHAPLTHVPSPTPTGSASTLEVRVNDMTWHEVPSLHRAPPDDHVFVIRDGPSGAVEVRTGDGLRGARPATGQHNIRAVYRKGIGTAGNLPAGALTQLASPPLGVTGVTNPAPAAGGADPDSVEHAREGIPQSTRTLGRAVSLPDYADFARTYAGIAKAHVAVLPLRNVRTIVVTVAGEGGAAVPPEACARLVTALRGHGDPLVPVVVVPYRPVPFQFRMKVHRHPDHEAGTVLTAAAAALAGAFGFRVREFAEPVHASEVIAAAHHAPGVVAVDLDALFRGLPSAGRQRLLAAGPSATGGSQVRGAETLLLTADPRRWLTEMP
ncbi:putative baseplate assembly protein [Spongiactinospora sp. TRM90649]|uniref:putative baseplate assembly protein n=1 Tax=Spongiactinospora sp. TRM90649 TaxID=3031114 RepID=UPI0023F922C0|nr:putative baseplate assembly protein [Spongiactinospora sp. TRM90649]MDF5753130.1 putative baseplate assembly protein [Spongiactinospora sp. TRM90649]